MRRPHSDEELKMKSLEVNQQEGDEGAAVRGENPSRTSKLPAGGVVLLVLVGLLAAALIVIYRLSFLLTNQTLQTLKEENEALRRNLSDPTRLKSEAGWKKHGGNCYYFNIIRSSWNDSRRSCQHLGSDLVKIDSREEQVFLDTRLRGMLSSYWDKFWIGLTDSEEEGKWLLVDGSAVDERFWTSWEPDDWKEKYPAGEDCAAIGKTEEDNDLMGWFDQFCDLQWRSICEI